MVESRYLLTAPRVITVKGNSCRNKVVSQGIWLWNLDGSYLLEAQERLKVVCVAITKYPKELDDRT